MFEEGTFKPAAKITEGKQYSIITDYLGTPVQMYDGEGKLSWDCSLDIYGKVRSFSGRSLSDCPFRYQGQYEDEETGLYYNRFRYYSPEEGMYISQDPIGLEGNNPTFYGYVGNTNSWIDPFGLDELYALIAKQDGWYPVFKYGKEDPIGEVFLKQGDLWKIGTSVDSSKRYSKTYLKNIGQGLETKVLHTNINRKTSLFLESLKLRGYLAWKGYLPAGNKCCH